MLFSLVMALLLLAKSKFQLEQAIKLVVISISEVANLIRSEVVYLFIQVEADKVVL